MEYDGLVYACAISRIFNYDCTKAKLLTDNYPSLEDVFSLSRNELKDILGEKSKYVDEILDHTVLRESEKEVEWALEHNIRVFYIGDSDYPHRLKECNDAPVVLFYKGTSNLNASKVVSIVGTRKATPYGRDICQKIIRSLSEVDVPPVIVSGLAYGIDICAHREALQCGLETVGVMATGIDAIYPLEHREIAVKMVKSGGVLTDFPQGSAPVPLNFVRRNRIIAGLCDAIVLIESKKKGGGMVSVKMAYSYSREVFAVPGKITDIFSEGCNLLIKDNIAIPITDFETIPKNMGWKKISSVRETNSNLLIFESDNPVKVKILKTLSSYVSLDPDSLIEVVGASFQEILLSLTELELEGRVVSNDTGKFSIA